MLEYTKIAIFYNYSLSLSLSLWAPSFSQDYFLHIFNTQVPAD